MFTKEEEKILTIFYTGDYQLADELMAATKNYKLIDKIICKFYKLFFKYKQDNKDYYLYKRGCTDIHSEGSFKDGVSLYVYNLLINGFHYCFYKNEYCDDGKNGILKGANMHTELFARVYIIDILNINIFKQQLKELGIRLIKI